MDKPRAASIHVALNRLQPCSEEVQEPGSHPETPGLVSGEDSMQVTGSGDAVSDGSDGAAGGDLEPDGAEELAGVSTGGDSSQEDVGDPPGKRHGVGNDIEWRKCL